MSINPHKDVTTEDVNVSTKRPPSPENKETPPSVAAIVGQQALKKAKIVDYGSTLKITAPMLKINSDVQEKEVAAYIIQEKQLTQGNDVDAMVNEILNQYPELNEELDHSSESLKNILLYIFEIQRSGSYIHTQRFVKNEKHVFTIDVLSENKAYIEIKRSQEDKKKQGGESKFVRLISLDEGLIEKYVGLKARLDISSETDIIQKRLAKIHQIKSYHLDPQLVALPKEEIKYVKAKSKLDQKQEQLLVVYEHLGNSIIASASEEKWDFKKTIESIIKVAQALQHIHSLGLLHRDIKPHNIFAKTKADQETIIRIGDLGFLISEIEAQKTELAGTFDYFSLKTFQGKINGLKPFNTQASDRHALGVTFLHLLQNATDFIDIRSQAEELIKNPNNTALLHDQLAILKSLDPIAESISDLSQLIQVISFLKNTANPQIEIITHFSTLYQLDSVKDPTELLKGLEAQFNEKTTKLSETLKNDKTIPPKIHSRLESIVNPQVFLLILPLLRDFIKVRYHFEQNQLLGTILELLSEDKDTPLFQTYALIYDLLEEDKIQNTAEIVSRLEKIQEKF